MNQSSQDGELLLPFEKKVLSGGYRDYYQTKRNNFFASVERYGRLWQFHLLLDEIWLREIGNLRVAHEPAKSIPMLFFMAAHAKLRISVELAFSGCIPEAHSILRDAVESVAFGHYMLRRPELQEIWLRKDEPEGKNAFLNSFQKDKKLNLFAGLEDLYKRYGELSEMGSHPTMQSMSSRVIFSEQPTHFSLELLYTGAPADEETHVTSLFSLLLTSFVIENTFFADYQDRLNLDHELLKMRLSLDSYKVSLARQVIEKFNITSGS